MTVETREGLPFTRAGRCQADEIAHQICDIAFSLYKSAKQGWEMVKKHELCAETFK